MPELIVDSTDLEEWRAKASTLLVNLRRKFWAVQVPGQKTGLRLPEWMTAKERQAFEDAFQVVLTE